MSTELVVDDPLYLSTVSEHQLNMSELKRELDATSDVEEGEIEVVGTRPAATSTPMVDVEAGELGGIMEVPPLEGAHLGSGGGPATSRPLDLSFGPPAPGQNNIHLPPLPAALPSPAPRTQAPTPACPPLPPVTQLLPPPPPPPTTPQHHPPPQPLQQPHYPSSK